MLRHASYGGYKELCVLAKKWGEESGTEMDWEQMHRWASSEGNKEICDLAKKWGATE
jgi:hypothetical protein